MSEQNQNSESQESEEAQPAKSEEKLIYLFTSTNKTYIKDALDLLALPSGMTYRFRYDIRYLGNEFFENDTKSKLKDLPTKDALIIHVRTTPEVQLSVGETPKILESIPIRKARILETKLFGDFVWIEFQLGDWIKYENPKNSSLNQYHNTIKEILPLDSREEYKVTAVIGDLKNFENIKEGSSNQDEFITNWTNLVSYIKAFDEHKKSVFLKLLKIIDMENLNELSPKDLSNNKHGFILESGKSYQIEFIQRYYGKIDEVPFSLEVGTNIEDVIQVKASDQIQGKYDLLRFTFSTISLARERYSFLTIQPEQKISKAFLISRPFYNLKIKRHVKSMARYISLISGGIVLTSSASWFPDLTSQIPTQLSFLETVLPIAGGVIIAIGAILIPKK